jgi:hypothetical protein
MQIIVTYFQSMKRYIFIVFVIFGLLLGHGASGQNKKLFSGQYHHGKYEPKISFSNIKKYELLSIYLNLGIASYEGDLCSGFNCISPRPAFGGGAIYRTGYLGKRLNLRLEAQVFRLYSDDKFKGRNLDFRSTNWEVWTGLQFDLFPYEKLLRRRTLFNPYAFIGVGVMTYDPWGSLPNGRWHQLRPLETQGYRIGYATMTFPMGIGTKYKINYKWTLKAEIGLRFTLTDQIDDVREFSYADPATLKNSIARLMSDKSKDHQSFAKGRQRGSPDWLDKYVIFNVGAIYTFTYKHQTKVRGRTHLLRK